MNDDWCRWGDHGSSKQCLVLARGPRLLLREVPQTIKQCVGQPPGAKPSYGTRRGDTDPGIMSKTRRLEELLLRGVWVLEVRQRDAHDVRVPEFLDFEAGQLYAVHEV